ncbi:MAG: hypothetical protein IJ112_05805 [Oscillospiraceae bacterium]|nr:hypothetical protein [Oscillospiraceae bacterium]
MSANEQLHIALRQEISAMTPNRVDDLLARLGPQPTPASDPAETVTRRPARRVYRQLIAAVLALVLLGAGVFYGVMRGRRSTVIIDADASVAFTVDGFDRVRSVRLEDARAVSVVDPTQLTGKRLDDAVTLVTTLFISGDVLSETDNAVLVSVQEDNAGRADALAQRTNNALSLAATDAAIAPHVLLQTLPEQTSAVAGTGLGKTALVDKLTGGSARADELLQASVQDLIYYTETQDIPLEDTTTLGTLNTDVYYSDDAAVTIACEAAGLAPAYVSPVAELGWQGSELVYIVTLQPGSGVQYYCVSARTGEVLDSYMPDLTGVRPEETPAPVETTPAVPSAPVTPGGSATPVPVPSVPVPAVPSVDPDSFRRFVRFWEDIDDLI